MEINLYFAGVHSREPNWQYVIIGSGNDLVPNRHQVISWNNDNIQFDDAYIYTSPDLSVLFFSFFFFTKRHALQDDVVWYKMTCTYFWKSDSLSAAVRYTLIKDTYISSTLIDNLFALVLNANRWLYKIDKIV